MRDRYITVEDYESNQREIIIKLIEAVVADEVSLTIKWKFEDAVLCGRCLEEIAVLLQSIGRKKEFLLNNVIETRDWKNVLRWNEVLNRYGFTIQLVLGHTVTPTVVSLIKKKTLLETLICEAEEFQEIQNTFQRFSGCEVNIDYVNEAMNMEQYRSLFEQWIMCRDSCWIENFRDILLFLLSGEHTRNCQHSSCLGKNLCIDKDGFVYFCEKKLQGSRMYHGRELQANDSPFQKGYEIVLDQAIEKRKNCKTVCSMYPVCQGGCILKLEDCGSFQEKVKLAADLLQKYQLEQFVNIPNPVIRKRYLTIIGFGFYMLK